MRKTITLILVILSLSIFSNCDILGDLLNQENNGNTDNNQNPTIKFNQPTNGITLGKDIGVVVEASDQDGTVTQVDLYINNKFVRSDFSSPYQWGTSCSQTDNDLINLPNGTYKLKATAKDNDGGSTSATITVTVDYSDNSVPHTFILYGYAPGHAWDPNTPDTDCSSCHGNDLKGGISGVSCFSCHGDNWSGGG